MWLILQLIFSIVIPSGVSNAFSLPDEIHKLPLGQHIEYLSDPKGNLTIADVLSQKQWLNNEKPVFNQGYNNTTWWLKISLSNQQDKQRDYWLEIAYPVLDHATLFIVQNLAVLQNIPLGDKKRFALRPIKHRFYLVPIHWSPQDSLEIYVQVKTSSSVQVPLYLWDQTTYFEHTALSTLLNGIFFGTMIIMFVYNSLIYLVLRSKSYLYYVGYVFSMIVMLAGIGGYSFQYLWPNAIEWNDRSILVSLSCIAMFGTLFSKSFLNIKAYSNFAANIANVFIACGGVIFVMSFIAPYSFVIRAMIMLAVIACVSMFIIAIYCLAKGAVSARYYIIAWSFMLAGCTILAFNKIGVLPSNILTDYAAHFGSSIEVMMLSFALAQSINHERRMRLIAQEQALTLRNEHNQKLEQKVAERTQELEDLNNQLRQLSTTDQLTGLKNRRFLDDNLQEELLRARRYDKELAVLIMDIDHFKRLNDTYGHLAGDECLKAVARELKNCARFPSDRVVRYGGEEFCIILPEINEGGAMVVGERVRQSIENLSFHWQNQRIMITISIGIYLVRGTDEITAENALAFADEALYLSKEGGRNKVTIYE